MTLPWFGPEERITRSLSQIEVSAEVAIQARSQALGHKVKAVSPVADERRLDDEGDCKMPRVTPRISEVGDHLRGGRSGAGPRISVISTESPGAGAVSENHVHGLFSRRVYESALSVLLCTLALSLFAGSQIEVSAEVAIQARSQALGHKVKAVSPVADERRLVFRQFG
jgi:hypothetical protein